MACEALYVEPLELKFQRGFSFFFLKSTKLKTNTSGRDVPSAIDLALPVPYLIIYLVNAPFFASSSFSVAPLPMHFLIPCNAPKLPVPKNTLKKEPFSVSLPISLFLPLSRPLSALQQ